MNATNQNRSLADIYRCSLPELRAVTRDLDDWEHNIKLIWYIGAGLSTLGYCLMLLTAIVFPAWRNSDQNRVWMHMVTSNLAWIYLFVTRDFSMCMGKIMLILLIYSGQVTFFWMLASSWLTYRKLVTVLPDTCANFTMRALPFTWLAPLPFCLIRGAVEWVVYPDMLFDERANNVTIKVGLSSISLKSIRHYIFFIGDVAMYFPVLLTIMASIIVYVLVLHTLFRNHQAWGKRTNRGAYIAIGVMFLFSSGVQFLFVVVNRFFTYTKLDYFSAFLTTFNVFLYSIMFIVAIKETRQLWLMFVKKLIHRRGIHSVI